MTNAIIEINSKFDDWQKFIDVRPASREIYRKALKQFFIYLQGNNIIQPTRETVINWREDLKQRVKPATAQIYLVAVKQFFKWTAANGIYANICENVKGVKISTAHKKDALTQSQAAQVLASIDTQTKKGLRDYCLIALMITGGLRTIEISRANKCDVQEISGEKVLFIQGKGHDDKDAIIKIAPAIFDKLQKYLNLCDMKKIPLFESKTCNRLTTKAIREIVKKVFLKNGLTSERLSAHSLRHTAATLALLHGIDIRQVQQLLRHTNLNTTLIYSHDIERMKNNSEYIISNCIL